MATAFQLNAFQNPETYDHFGFQVSVTPIVGPDGIASAFTIDQSVQMASDQWELALTSSEQWRARSRTNSVDLSTGLINALGDPDLVKHVKEGKTDEWELEFLPDKLIGRMRGRDAMAFALDTALFISYVSGGVAPPAIDPALLPPGLQPILGVTERLYLPGHWLASTICRDLATRVGLDISYQAPEYVLREDVEVNGPALGAIQQIIEPFTHFEPFKVDVWVEGKTLMIRQRQGLVESPGPLGPLPGTLNTVSIGDLRANSLTIRAHFLDYIRIFRALGAVLDCSASSANRTIGIRDQFTAGDFRTTIAKEVRVLDKADMGSQTDVVDLRNAHMVSRETVVHLQDPLILDANCRIINSPLDRGSQTLLEEEIQETFEGLTTTAFRQTKRITVTNVYDNNNFMTGQDTVTEERDATDPASQLQVTKRESQVFSDNGPKMWGARATKWSIDSDGTSSVDSVQSAPGSGVRPGGPGRAPVETATDSQRAFKAAIIDNLPGAKDFSLKNDNLKQDQIDMIYNQAVASSGAQEYEVQFVAAQIPWIKKGQMLKITGLVYEDGVTPVDLPNMLVLDTRIVHTEESSNPTSLVQIKAVFWSKTWGQG